MSFLDWLTGAASSAPAELTGVAPMPASPLDSLLPPGLAAAAPKAPAAVWLPALAPPMQSSGIITPRRVAAFLGRCVAEAGDDFAELAENTLYTHAARLVAVFPREFPTLDIANRYAGNPVAIANRAYAGKLGNGDEASGDGYRFRGAGLFQLTGRDEIGGFAKAIGRDIADAADYLRTPPGAAAGACWYWTGHGMNALADAWNLPGITRAVNGAAMLGLDTAVAASVAALKAMS